MKHKINKYSFLGSLGQWLSIFIMGYGIYLLFNYKIDFGTIFFSIGCLVETLSTKLKYYGKKCVKRNKQLYKTLCKKGEIDSLKGEKSAVGAQGCFQFF